MKFIATAVIAGLLATGLATSTPAEALAGCVVSASLPAKVSIHSVDTIVYTTLHGSQSCLDPSYSVSAMGYFSGPGTTEVPWFSNFGVPQKMELVFVTPGTYRMERLSADLYDYNYNDIPVTWQNTSTSIREASRIVNMKTSRTLRTHVKISARVQRYGSGYAYTYIGYRPYTYLQRKAAGWATWHAFKTFTPTSSGSVSYSYSTLTKYTYRMVVKDSWRVWGSKSASSTR